MIVFGIISLIFIANISIQLQVFHIELRFLDVIIFITYLLAGLLAIIIFDNIVRYGKKVYDASASRSNID